MSEDKQTRKFEAEVSQLLDLMIHSMYKNREVFLRELISNASDAIDKLRFEALSDEELFEGQTDLRIDIEFDEEDNTVVVRDTGIGMSRQEVADNIGTIARSGTREFLEKLKSGQENDAELIGQFGIGFYSAFIVADKVVLRTRRAGQEEGVRWESDGKGEYEISTVERQERGTEIVLHLREDAEEFLDGDRIERVVRRYSDHISFPIYLHEPGEDDEGPRQINEASALWTRPRSEIDDEEYVNFYRHVTKGFDEPLTWVHSKVEGRLKFSLLFYVPGERPLDLAGPHPTEGAGGVKLYVKKVFILDDAEMFLPRYLRFIRGVVDADDLPLNVSREMLQDNRVVAAIRKTATKRALQMLEELSEDQDDYQKFWSTFGPILKEGIVEDPGRKQEVASLCRFASTAMDSSQQTVSLDEYVERMKDGQEAIYYITADSYEAAVASPHLEIFAREGIEVLVMTDTVDEWVSSHLSEYDEIPVKSVDRATPDVDGDDEQEETDELNEEWSDVIERVESALGGSVQQVRMSKRLTESPACLVREQWQMGERMKRMMEQAGQQVPTGTPTMELNPDHPLVARLRDIDDEQLEEWSKLFFDQARLSEGAVLEAPAVFVRRLNRLMGQLSGEPNDDAD